MLPSFLRAVLAFDGALECFVLRNDLQRAVRPRRHVDDAGAMAVEVTENPLAVLESAAVGAGVAVDAQDGGATSAPLCFTMNARPSRLWARVSSGISQDPAIGRDIRGRVGRFNVADGVEVVLQRVAADPPSALVPSSSPSFTVAVMVVR